jgi:kumamolisin
MTSFVPLPGSHRTPLPNSRSAGPVNGADLATVTVRVRSKGDPADLAKLAYDLAGQPVAQRKYLTLAQLEDQHGAAGADLDAIEHYAHDHNLRVGRRSAVERVVTLKGRLSDLLAAFPSDVRLYHHSTGGYRGRSGTILVPEQLSKVITGVFGFDTRRRRRTRHRQILSAQAGPGGDNGLAATDFATRYAFPPGDGSGQTIAIIELGGGYRTSDLQVFFHEIGVAMPNVASVSVDNAVNDPSTDPQSADGEVMLDIEVAGAVAPKASYVVYFAPNNGDQGFQDAISMAVHDARQPSAVSISWGSPEDYTDDQGLAAYHEIFAAAGALGVTVCAATGDHGTADADAPHWDGKPHVNHPSSDDLVLACGGTQVTGGKDVVWNDGTTLEAGGWATGGGVSGYFAVPDYQKNANVRLALHAKAGARPARHRDERNQLLHPHRQRRGRGRRHQCGHAADGGAGGAAQPGQGRARRPVAAVPLRQRGRRPLR